MDNNPVLIMNGSLMISKVLQNAPLGAFCNTLTCIQVIIGLENQVLVFLSFFTVFN